LYTTSFEYMLKVIFHEEKISKASPDINTYHSNVYMHKNGSDKYIILTAYFCLSVCKCSLPIIVSTDHSKWSLMPDKNAGI